MSSSGTRGLVDLTRPIEPGMPVYPGDPNVAIDPHATHDADGYRVSRVTLGTHTGTHVDAPAHVDPDGATLGAFGPEDLRFQARVIDCRDADANEAIAPPVVETATENSDVNGVDAIVFRTGWAEEWGTDRMADHPYLAPETARQCADAGIAAIVDTLSPDPGDGDLPAHHALLGAGLPIVENVCNLGSLPARDVELLVCPLKIDADGAPARVFAQTRRNSDKSG